MIQEAKGDLEEMVRQYFIRPPIATVKQLHSVQA